VSEEVRIQLTTSIKICIIIHSIPIVQELKEVVSAFGDVTHCIILRTPNEAELYTAYIRYSVHACMGDPNLSLSLIGQGTV